MILPTPVLTHSSLPEATSSFDLLPWLFIASLASTFFLFCSVGCTFHLSPEQIHDREYFSIQNEFMCPFDWTTLLSELTNQIYWLPVTRRTHV